MTIQTGRNIDIAYAPQSAPGELPDQATSKTFRVNSGALVLSTGAIKSGENRRDGLMTRSRNGQRDVKGSYVADLAIGAFDDLIAAAFRGTLGAVTTITQATAAMATATITTAGNAITSSAGSWITAGLKVGDVFRPTVGLAPADLGKNLRITALTATVLTVAEPLTTVTAVATWSFTSGKKLLQGTTPQAFYFEEREHDIDISEGFDWCRVGSFQVAMQPNGMGELTFAMVGRDGQVYDGSSDPVFPYFTGQPAVTTGVGLTAVEAKIMVGGVELSSLTALTIGINLNAAGIPVIGSVVTPDVLTNLADMSACTMTMLRSDAQQIKDFIAETPFEIHVLFTENTADPKNYVSFFLGNVTLGGDNKSNIGSDGPRTVTIPLNVGADDRGGAFDLGMVKFQTT